MRILVCLGTHSQDFSRLAKAVDDYAGTVDYEFIVQTGVTCYPFKHIVKYFDYCSKDVMSDYMDSADVLILQGGWGGMEEAIDAGKRIVAVPRIEGVEHIHNQEQLVRKLDAMGCVIGCFDVDTLAACVEKALTFRFMPLKKGLANTVISDCLKAWFE